MSTPTYLFYDIETTGLNKCFDQVLQFAAIRTDLNLKELERHHIHCRLNKDVIPTPMAMITHRIRLADIQKAPPEIDAIREIHRLINSPGTISLGYNTLGFDVEFLRFSFYRNLLPPYTHQFANQCRRMDLYPMTVMYYLFKRDALKWPELEGHLTLKLEHLSRANQLAEGQAHDAMVDVEATLALAKKLMAHKTMWDYVSGYFEKNTDIKRAQQLPVSFQSEHMPMREALVIQGYFGASAYFQAPVLGLGQHQHYKNQSLWLSLDSDSLQTTTADSIAETTRIVRKRAGEQVFLLPPNERFLTHLSPERRALANENKAWLQENPTLLQLICDYHQQYKYPKVENVDVDAALYDIKFPTSQEESLFRQFHAASPDKKEKIALQFPNPIRREQAFRILARHYPAALSEANAEPFEKQANTVDYRNRPRLTPALAQQAIEQLRKEKELDAEQLECLAELEEAVSHF